MKTLASIFHPTISGLLSGLRLRRIKSQSGFSLLEIVMGVVIIGIAFVSAMYALTELQNRSTRIEIMLKATTMANNIMEIVRSNDFDEYDSPPWSNPLGPEENSPNQYDDVDDYIGYIWSFPGFTGYQGLTRVYYVNPNISWIDSANAVTNYKYIWVQVTHEGLDVPIILTSLITPRVSAADETGGLGPPPPPP